MAQEHESEFERELCEHLAAHGWLYSENGEGYDKTRALFEDDVFGWLRDTQPDELAKVIKPGASSADERKSKDQFLDRLVKALDAPLESGGGTLNVLRKGFKKTPGKFQMCEFKPATTLNAATLERYDKVDELDVFRKDLGSFIRLYDFLSQIVNYQDTDLEKRSLYLRFLARQITAKNRNQEVDFSTVELTHIKQTRTADRSLDLGTGEAKGLKPFTATGSGESRDPNMVRLEAILAKVNDLFAGEDFTVAEQRSWVEGVVTVLMHDDTIQTQASNNSKKQFMESPDLNDAVVEAVLGNQTTHNKMADIFFTDDKVKLALVHVLGELVHENLKADEQSA